MRVVSLASGSSGNATLVEAGGTSLLIDAGLASRTLAGRLKRAGRAPRDLAGIILTHEHYDHSQGALGLARENQLPVMADARTLKLLSSKDIPEGIPQTEVLDPHPVGTTWTVGALTITSFSVPHDAVAPCGYRVTSGAWSLTVVTDCGEINDAILSHMRQANLIIVEANHDREKLIKGPYPYHLKQRILSPQGHLANDQTAAALHSFVDDGPRWIWLGHLSRTNNTPDLAHNAICGALGARRLRSARVSVAPPGYGLTWDSATLLSGLAGV